MLGWHLRGRVMSIWVAERGCREVSHIGGEWRSLNLEDIDIGLQAPSQIEIIGANFKPALWLLIDVQTTADFDDPTIVEFDRTIVKMIVEFDP
jgi:hypothetical protein